MPADRLEGYAETWTFGALARASRGAPKVDGGQILGNVAALRYTTLARSGGIIGVAVTAGTTLIVTRLRFTSTVAGTAINLGYGDTDVGESGAAAPTNFLRVTPRITLNGSPYLATVVLTLYDLAVYYEIPAGKFLCVEADIGVQTSRIETLGVEV